jgi:heme/copper-type cytochrome/quinol oxidase subunit 4
MDVLSIALTALAWGLAVLMAISSRTPADWILTAAAAALCIGMVYAIRITKGIDSTGL